LRRLYTSSARELKRMEAVSRSPLVIQFAETVAGLPVVQAHGAATGMYHRLCRLVDQNTALFMHGWLLMPWLALYLEEIVAVIFLSACTSAVLMRHLLDPALVAVALTNSMSLLSKVQITCRQSAEVENLFTAVERLAHFLAATPQEDQGVATSGPLVAEWPSAGHIRFENVSLRYRPGLPLVLRSLCFSVAAGSSVGLIGASGSGKSSCLGALLRMLDIEAGRDGVDLRTVPLKALRASIAVVSQEPLVLSGSVRSNLLPGGGRVAVSDEESKCWAVLEMLGLKQVVQDLPNRLDTELAAGEERALSLGQRQLLSFGRALLRPAKVLCIDEATAHVDGATDAALQQALAERAASVQQTRFIVAHRLWTLRHCHEVLLLKPGSPTTVTKIRNPAHAEVFEYSL